MIEPNKRLDMNEGETYHKRFVITRHALLLNKLCERTLDKREMTIRFHLRMLMLAVDAEE